MGEPAQRKAGLLQLSFMIYGASCAGAFGVEEMISGCGPGLGLLIMVVVPFFFCLPIAFAVGELTAAFPVEGGNYRWSRMAFGDFWGFQAAWWLWMTGVLTNVIFAVLFANYLQQLLPTGWVAANPGLAGLSHWLVCVALIWAMHFLNVRGIEVVGNVSILLSVLLLIPFVILTWLGFSAWTHDPFGPFLNPGQKLIPALGSGVPLAIFLYSGYDKLSAVAEEVDNPQKTFPPALIFAVTLAILSYMVPTIASLAALGNWESWTSAYFPTAAGLVGGAGLARAITWAGLASNALLLNVTMLAVSRIPLALAEDGFLPGFLKRRHPVYGTPIESLFWGSVTYSALTLLDFSQLLIMNSWFQMTTNLLLFANLWKLRRTHPEAPRPFCVPGGRIGLILCTGATTVLALVAIASTVSDGTGLQQGKLLLGLGSIFSGVAAYWVTSVERRLGWAAVDPRQDHDDPAGAASG